MNFGTPLRSLNIIPAYPTTPDSALGNSSLQTLPSSPASDPTSGTTRDLSWSTPSSELWGGHKFSSPASSPYGKATSTAAPTTPLINVTNENVSTPAAFRQVQQAQDDSGKRGRPRADHITHLILEGASSPSGIKCRVCNRVFPREKSLQVQGI